MTTSLFGKDILDLLLLSDDEIRLIMDTTARYEKVMQNGGRLMNLYGKTLICSVSVSGGKLNSNESAILYASFLLKLQQLSGATRLRRRLITFSNAVTISTW